MNFNRFDFEQQLLHTWNIVEDIQTILDAIDRGASQDDILNMLIGLKGLQNSRTEKLWDMFEAGIKAKKIL